MIWISRGRGGWAFWLPLIFLILFAVADDHHLLPKSGSHAFGWIFGGPVLAAGLIIAAMGFYLNRGAGFWTIDSATGLRYFDKSARHSLYCIPMQYWGLFYCALVITIAAVKR